MPQLATTSARWQMKKTSPLSHQTYECRMGAPITFLLSFERPCRSSNTLYTLWITHDHGGAW
eukprot:scaffold30391_cov123-Skeletonema_marinoi.AAC.1